MCSYEASVRGVRRGVRRPLGEVANGLSRRNQPLPIHSDFAISLARQIPSLSRARPLRSFGPQELFLFKNREASSDRRRTGVLLFVLHKFSDKQFHSIGDLEC